MTGRQAAGWFALFVFCWRVIRHGQNVGRAIRCAAQDGANQIEARLDTYRLLND